MPIVTAGEQDIFYFEYRVSASRFPPVLLIHGAGGQHTHWPPQVRRLPGARTFAPDLPGHGRSPGEGRSSIAAYAADMLALMDALEQERFVVVGHSMGGAIAQEMALAAPERVAGIGMIATGAQLPVSETLLSSCLTDFGKVVDFVMAYGFGPHVDENARRLGRRQLAACRPEVVYGDYLACDLFDTSEQLGKIAVPALVVGGTADRMTPPRLSQYLADHLPDVEYYLVEEAGHFLPSEYPDDVAEIITDWLERRFGAA